MEPAYQLPFSDPRLSYDEILALPFHVSNTGYAIIRMKGHPLAWKGGKMKRSRAVMWSIGQPCAPGEIVHHLDENRLNDEPANLFKMRNGAHTTEHKTGVPHPNPHRWSEAEREFHRNRMLGNKLSLGIRYKLSDEQKRAISLRKSGQPMTCSICGKVGVNAKTHGKH